MAILSLSIFLVDFSAQWQSVIDEEYSLLKRES